MRASPTRMNLLRAQRRLGQVTRGVGLLRRKREALVTELFKLARPAADARALIADAGLQAYPLLLAALSQHGRAGLRALAWPERMDTPAERLDLARIGSLSFEVPNIERFPALRVSREALEAGGAAPIVLNAANEEAVSAFLARRIGFLDILRTVEEAVARTSAVSPQTIAEVIDIDRRARTLAQELMSELAA